MNSIQFTVFGSPVAQPRQRHRVIYAPGGKAFAANYTPKRDPVNQWKSTVSLAAKDHFNGPLWDGPIWLHLWFYLPRPASRSRKKDADGAVPCVTKPDCENMAKAIMDCFSGIFYRDDKQVFELRVQKYFHEKDGRPRVEVKIGIVS